MDLQMTQKALSKQFIVSENSITYWELGRSQPLLQFYPRIIAFLGYIPFEKKGDTLRDQLHYARIITGLSYKKLGKRLGVCWDTLRYLEQGKRVPTEETVQKIKMFLEEVL